MRRARRPTAVWLVAALAAAGCGKKGPPLAPILRVPAAVEGVTARRVGETVYLEVPAPATNIDGSVPADVTRIEIYGATATAAPPRARFLEIATLVGTVHPPSPPEPGTPPPATGPVVLALREHLTPDALQPRTLAPLPNARPLPAVPSFTQETASPSTPQRYYLAIPFSTRGRPGPTGNPTVLPLAPLPDAPPAPRITYSETEVIVEWEPSGGIIGFLMGRALPVETLDDAPPAPPPARTLYNVYRELAPDPLVLPPPSARAAAAANTGSTATALPGAPVSFPVAADAPPAPVTTAPLDAFVFAEPVEFERERCYEIRAVHGTGVEAAEGLASPRACIVPVDVFPPPAPAGVSAVAAEGAISLIWEPNTDADTAGYLVLRGSGAGATLQPITPTPIVEARFTDKTVTSGERYTYAVVAVDARVPVPNASVESPRVEETAR